MTSIVSSVAVAAHAAAANLLAASPIAVGDKLPVVEVKEDDPETKINIPITGKIVIIGVPGAYTPPCSSQVPGYIENYDKFVAKGVKGIYVVAVNDAFVTKSWKEKLSPGGTPVHFIADDTAQFVSKLGLIFDGTGLLGGPRSKRFALLVDEGTVTHVAVEDAPPNITVTKWDAVLGKL